jgi:hypothetical protein
MFRKDWTPHEADEWTREDYWAMLFSSLSYFLLTIGIGLCFLVPFWGILTTAAGLASGWIMYRIIDPKLKTVSSEYESKQKEYLKQLEQLQKWEKR